MAKAGTEPTAAAKLLREAEARTSEARARDAAGAYDKAPAQPFIEDPDSAINKTSTTLKEMAALEAYGFDPFNISLDEIEERIGLLSRAIIEYYLRTNYLKPEKKAELALNAIRTLEGTKTEISWKENRRSKPKPITIEAYRAERARKEARLQDLLTKKAEHKVQSAQDALELLNGKATSDE